MTDDEQFKIDCLDAVSRSVDNRIDIGFRRIYIPELSLNRIFNTMKEYKEFCKTVPEYLGYGT